MERIATSMHQLWPLADVLEFETRPALRFGKPFSEKPTLINLKKRERKFLAFRVHTTFGASGKYLRHTRYMTLGIHHLRFLQIITLRNNLKAAIDLANQRYSFF